MLFWMILQQNQLNSNNCNSFDKTFYSRFSFFSLLSFYETNATSISLKFEVVSGTCVIDQVDRMLHFSKRHDFEIYLSN